MLRAGGTQACGCCALWWAPIALPPSPLGEAGAGAFPASQRPSCTLSLPAHVSLAVGTSGATRPRSCHRCRSARFSPGEIRRASACLFPPHPTSLARTEQGSPSMAGMLTPGSAKPRGGGQPGEEKSSSEREGGGMQEEDANPLPIGQLCLLSGGCC